MASLQIYFSMYGHVGDAFQKERSSPVRNACSCLFGGKGGAQFE